MSMLKKTTLWIVVLIMLAAGSISAETVKQIEGEDYTIQIQDGKIVFILAREGESASVPGYFNNWKPEAPEAQMEKRDDGKFYLEVDLEAFAAAKPYEYKFYVDGQWDPDPNKKVNLVQQDGEWFFESEAEAGSGDPDDKEETEDTEDAGTDDADETGEDETGEEAAPGGALDKVDISKLSEAPDDKILEKKDYKLVTQSGYLVFILNRDGEKASVPGSFNGWKPEEPGNQMVRKDGKFYYAIKASEFAASKPPEFKFHVDGNWDPDPNKSANMKEKDGEWVFVKVPGDKIKPNSDASTAIEFSGRYTVWFPTQMNVSNEDWNASGDDGIYISDVSHNFYLDTDYKLGGFVLGFSRLKVNYQQNGNRRLTLDAMDAKFVTDDVKLISFYRAREKDVNFDNPLRSLYKYEYTGYNGINFFNEETPEMSLFGRDHMGINLKVESIWDLSLLFARRVNDQGGLNENDIMAVRLKPLQGDLLNLGVSWMYVANRDAIDSVMKKAYSGSRFVNPLKWIHKTGYYNNDIGLDLVMDLGDAASLYVETRFISLEGTAGDKDTMGNDDTKINAVVGGKFIFSDLLFDVSGHYVTSDATNSNLFADVKARYDFGKKGYAALAFSMMVPDSGDSLFEQRLEGRYETTYFDLWLYESFRSLKGVGEAYNFIYAKMGVDWYFNARLIGVLGVRYLNTSSAEGFSSIIPKAGVKYMFSKNVKFELYYGRELEESAYLEDTGRYVEQYWTATYGADETQEKKMSKMHRITLKADMKF